METVTNFIFLGPKITADGECNQEIKRRLILGRKVMTNLDSVINSRDTTFLVKVRIVKAMVFSSSHVWMWELDYKEGCVPKNWCFWTMMLQKTIESPLDSKAAAATAAKSLQSCPTLCDPIGDSPLGSPVPGILQARTQDWVAISFSNAWKWKVKVKSLSHVRLFATPWTEIKPIYHKEISPEYSLEGLMLKLQYFGHLM